MGKHDHQALLRPLLAGVLARPIDAVAGRQFHLLVHFSDGLFHRAAEIAAAHAVLDRHVARIALAVDLRRPVRSLNRAKLRQGYPLSGRRQQANLLDRLLRIAVLGQIADHQVVALLALQHLADRVAAHRGLNGVLHVGYVDLVTRGLLAVHYQVQIGLADHAKQPQVLNPLNVPHHVDDLVALLFEQLEIVAVDLDRQFALDAAHGLFHVVGNRLGEVPDHARNLLQLAIHGGDQFLFVLVEDRPPLFLRFEIDEVFRIEEARGVRSVVRPSHLAGRHA